MVLAIVCSFGTVGTAIADGTQSTSGSYSITDVTIGGNGSALKDCSGSYCAQEEVGDTVDGRASSSHYGAQFGSNTGDIPLLEETVQGGTQNLGTLQSTGASNATFSLKVRSYLSSGYTLYINGSAPSQGEHTIKTLDTSCPCTSQPGTEQFGINLVANSTPGIGADPVQVPSAQFSFGEPLPDYDQANLFKYHNGDAVAQSLVSTGETDYTLSMIMNVSNATPGGQYTGSFSAIAVPQY